jgi:hypothetical protein
MKILILGLGCMFNQKWAMPIINGFSKEDNVFDIYINMMLWRNPYQGN